MLAEKAPDSQKLPKKSDNCNSRWHKGQKNHSLKKKIWKGYVSVIGDGSTETSWIPLWLLQPWAIKNTLEVTRKIANRPPAKQQKEISIISPEVKSAHLGPSYSSMHQGRSYFTNDSVFLTGPWDHKRLIHPSEEGTAFNFSLGFESLPICIGHHNTC